MRPTQPTAAPRKITLAIALLGITAFLLFATLSVAAFDPTPFLIHGSSVRVYENSDGPAVFPGGHDEKYFAIDKNGTYYKLRVQDAIPSLAEVISGVVMGSVGLPTISVYPFLAARGHNGLPSAEAAINLKAARTERFGLAGANGENFPASLLLPLADLAPLDWQKVNGSQLGEAFSSLIVMYVLGNRDVVFGSGTDSNIGFARDHRGESHFTVFDVTQSFKSYGSEETSLANYLELLVSTGANRELFSSEEFLFAINRTISRLERLSRQEIKSLLAGYERGLNNYRKMVKKIQPIDMTGEFFRRISEARGQAVHWLGERTKIPSNRLSILATKMAVDRPIVNLPASIPLENQRPRTPATEALWALYFQDFAKMRSVMMNDWANKLGASNRDVVAKVQSLAAKDMRTYYVGTGLSFQIPPSDTIQLGLRPHLEHLTVVVPINDREATTIAQMAKSIGVHTIELDLPHGQRLTEQLAAEIMRRAKDNGSR